MDLKALFFEKWNGEKKEEVKEIQKKIKKKDIEKVGIEDLELKYYEFDILKNIKIYNGLITEDKRRMKRTIRLLKIIAPHDKFTKLVPSVLSVQGSFTKILFNEELQMPLFKIPPKEFSSIIKIGCNFGEIYVFPNIYVPHAVDVMIKSIVELKGKNILIGCACQAPLNAEKILSILHKIKEDNVFLTVFELYFTEEKLELSGVAKSRIGKLLKNFQAMIKFKITDKDTIHDLYCAVDNIVNKEHINICNNYLDMIVEVLTTFTSYARSCKCWKKCQYKSIFAASTRGRKIKEKKEVKRKKQGTGMYFSSQITFDVWNEVNYKISKIKLFRNGNFQVPGVKFPDMRDLLDPLILLKDYWNKVYEADVEAKAEADIAYILSNMRNYKCHLVDGTLTILLNRLEDILYFEKDLSLPSLDNSNYIKLLEAFDFMPKINELIFKYVNFSFFTISEINNNPERYPGLLVKFNRPIPSKANKKLTIKILSSGKINFDGGNSELEVYELYYWLQFIFNKYWNEIIYDPRRYPFEIVSSDSDDYESIYDSS
jgi:hypothetical protein